MHSIINTGTVTIILPMQPDKKQKHQEKHSRIRSTHTHTSFAHDLQSPALSIDQRHIVCEHKAVSFYWSFLNALEAFTSSVFTHFSQQAVWSVTLIAQILWTPMLMRIHIQLTLTWTCFIPYELQPERSNCLDGFRTWGLCGSGCRNIRALWGRGGCWVAGYVLICNSFSCKGKRQKSFTFMTMLEYHNHVWNISSIKYKRNESYTKKLLVFPDCCSVLLFYYIETNMKTSLQFRYIFDCVTNVFHLNNIFRFKNSTSSYNIFYSNYGMICTALFKHKTPCYCGQRAESWIICTHYTLARLHSARRHSHTFCTFDCKIALCKPMDIHQIQNQSINGPKWTIMIVYIYSLWRCEWNRMSG